MRVGGFSRWCSGRWFSGKLRTTEQRCPVIVRHCPRHCSGVKRPQPGTGCWLRLRPRVLGVATAVSASGSARSVRRAVHQPGNLTARHRVRGLTSAPRPGAAARSRWRQRSCISDSMGRDGHRRNSRSGEPAAVPRRSTPTPGCASGAPSGPANKAGGSVRLCANVTTRVTE
jgi:hypothetical protein